MGVGQMLEVMLCNLSITMTTSVLLCCVLLLLWCSRIASGLPPGPYGLPLVGYLPWMDPTAPYLTLTKLVQRYGRVMSLRLGSVLVVVIADPQLVKDTLSNKNTTGRAPLYLTHGIMKGYGLICSEGELWREHRKFVLGLMRDLGMRTTATRAQMETKIIKAAHHFVQDVSESEGGVDVSSRLLHHVGNVMNQLIFGLTYQDNDPTWQWLRHLLEEGTKLVGVAGPLNFLPWLRFLPKYRRTISFITENQRLTHNEYQNIIDRYQDATNKQQKQDQQTKEVMEGDKETKKLMEEDKIEKLLDDNEKGMNQNEKLLDENEKVLDMDEGVDGKLEKKEEMKDEENLSSSSPQNLIEAYLKERECRGDNLGSFTLSQLYHVAADLFGAGSETTITTLKWHLLNMALYPHIQRRVHEELDNHGGMDEAVSMSDVELLPYTHATLLETQRLRSIVPLGIPHGTTQDMKVGGYSVPKGSMVLPLLWSIHHDPSSWTDPYTYVPERFVDQDGKIIKHSAFMPFQTGRRMCIGDEFAKMILFVFTTALLKRLEIGLGEGVEGDPSSNPVCGISLTPRPFTLTFTPRH